MAYWDLSPKAAPGVDGVTWESYGQDLVANLRDLHGRVQQGRCRASPTRRAYIPKADGRQRPLGIATLEDKIVQRAVVGVLNAIYEVDFRGFSYGFRPRRGAASGAGCAGGRDHDQEGELGAGRGHPRLLGSMVILLLCSFPSSEQAVLGLGHLDTQAFPASGAGQDGAQLTALDFLQYGLAGDAERCGWRSRGRATHRGRVSVSMPRS